MKIFGVDFVFFGNLGKKLLKLPIKSRKISPVNVRKSNNLLNSNDRKNDQISSTPCKKPHFLQ